MGVFFFFGGGGLQAQMDRLILTACVVIKYPCVLCVVDSVEE